MFGVDEGFSFREWFKFPMGSARHHDLYYCQGIV